MPETQKYYVVIPNWNGVDIIGDCLDSLKSQSLKSNIIVVDNGSRDGSVEFLEKNYNWTILLKNDRNLGFAGGVNAGIRYAMQADAKYVALLNSDAVADKDWLNNLVKFLDTHKDAGIVTSKIVDLKGTHIDSTGDYYTTWGLPYPRDRGREIFDSGDKTRWVFGASGGASLYRIKMLKEIGLFDEDFFAYYEDVDLSFRAQLAGWKVGYEPNTVVRHAIGATSGKVNGFTAYHTLKNLPLLLWKNVPWALMPKIWPRLVIAYSGIATRTIISGQFGPFFKGIVMGTILWPKKLFERKKIQSSRKVSIDYLNSIIVHDLPPNASNLRKLRSFWWKMRGKK